MVSCWNTWWCSISQVQPCLCCCGHEYVCRRLTTNTHDWIITLSYRYLFGGNNTSAEGRYRVLDDFFCFDTTTLTWKCLTNNKSDDFPSSRSGHALIPFGNKLLLFGGGVWDDNSAQWVHKYNHVYLYDTVRGDWHQAAAHGDISVCTFPSTARLGHYHLLVFGGQSTKNNWTTNELFVLDTGT